MNRIMILPTLLFWGFSLNASPNYFDIEVLKVKGQGCVYTNSGGRFGADFSSGNWKPGAINKSSFSMAFERVSGGSKPFLKADFHKDRDDPNDGVVERSCKLLVKLVNKNGDRFYLSKGHVNVPYYRRLGAGGSHDQNEAFITASFTEMPSESPYSATQKVGKGSAVARIDFPRTFRTNCVTDLEFEIRIKLTLTGRNDSEIKSSLSSSTLQPVNGNLRSCD